MEIKEGTNNNKTEESAITIFKKFTKQQIIEYCNKLLIEGNHKPFKKKLIWSEPGEGRFEFTGNYVPSEYSDIVADWGKRKTEIMFVNLNTGNTKIDRFNIGQEKATVTHLLYRDGKGFELAELAAKDKGSNNLYIVWNKNHYTKSFPKEISYLDKMTSDIANLKLAVIPELKLIIFIDFEINYDVIDKLIKKKEELLEQLNKEKLEREQKKSEDKQRLIEENTNIDAEQHINIDAEQHINIDAEQHINIDAEQHTNIDAEQHTNIDAETSITKFIANIEYPENIPDIRKDKINTFIIKHIEDIETDINRGKKQILNLKIKEFNEIIDSEEEKEKKEIFKKEQDKKEKDRRWEIDKNLENLSPDAKKAIENGTLFLEGPPGTSKSYDAEKIVCEIVNAYITDKEKDFSFEELKDKGLVDRIELDSSWSSSDLMGGMTYYTEEEDKRADNVMPISKSGILTRMNKRNIGLALKLNNEDIESNTISKIFNKYKEKVSDKNIYKYTKRHILLVEEASRGNFESIFGGTMTILEKERRLGEDNQTIVTSRSGYYYALAPSMIVICTRNIADKGAKNIDIGIMRRFPRRYRGPNFKRIEKYMNDNKEKLEEEGIYECMKHSIEALPIINNRIGTQLGIDYQIGHTYLYVKTKEEFISKWTDWILPSILDRCNRKLDAFNDMLFGEDRSELIDKQKGIPEFENIEDLDNFIIEIIGSGKNE